MLKRAIHLNNAKIEGKNTKNIFDHLFFFLSFVGSCSFSLKFNLVLFCGASGGGDDDGDEILGI